MKTKGVTIVTGFLGAGKTTFINGLINKLPETKFCIVENEFGAIGIDKELVDYIDESIFQLSNGCLCCTLNNELIDLLEKLIEQRDKYDHIIIETTGIAEPDTIVQLFLTQPSIQEYFHINSVVCVIDESNIEKSFENRKEVKKQLAYSDTFFINKSQSNETKAKIIEFVTNIHVGAKFIEAKDINSTLLERNCFELRGIEQEKDHKHTQTIQSFSFEFDGQFDLIKIQHWLNVLIAIQSTNVYRVKGIINVQHQEHPLILQSVFKQVIYKSGDNITRPEKSKIIIIGEGLDKAIIHRYLTKCLAKTI